MSRQSRQEKTSGSTTELKSIKGKSQKNSVLNKTNSSSLKSRKIKVVVLGKFGVGNYNIYNIDLKRENNST